MRQQLLQRFLQDEASKYVRQLLLRHIADCRAGLVHGKRMFEFNQFNVTVDCDSRLVILEDELNVAPDGAASWPIEEFAAALWR